MEDKDKKYGVIGTTIFHVAVLLLLIFFGLTTMPQEEEGILVNFGDTVLGQGEVEPKQSQAQPVEQQKTPPPPKVENVPEQATAEPEPEDEVKTQDYDEAPVVKSDAEKKKEKEEKERLEKERKEREEQERIEREKEEERKRIEAEEEAKRQKELAEKRAREEAERKKREEQERQAAEARNRVSGAFNGKGSDESTSEGDTGGSGNQGHVTGDPNSRNRSGSGLGDSGSGFDLKGRSLVGSLPQPIDKSNKDGIVVIKIRVDRYGKVTSAEFQLKGSTTQDRELIGKAKEAALRARFNSDENANAFAEGTITYHFQLD